MCQNQIFSKLHFCRFSWGSSCSSCDMGHSDPKAPKLSQKLMSSLFVRFQHSRTHPSDRFWGGGVLLVLLVVTGVKKVNS